MNFNEIINANKQNIKNIIKLITKQENEDIEQEVYIKLWKNAEKYEERGSLKSWVNTIAKNTSKDYLKSAVVKNEQNSTSDDLVLCMRIAFNWFWVSGTCLEEGGSGGVFPGMISIVCVTSNPV